MLVVVMMMMMMMVVMVVVVMSVRENKGCDDGGNECWVL